MGIHIPASSCSQQARRERDSGDLRAVPSPPRVSGSEGHPAKGGEGMSLTPPLWSLSYHSILRVTQARWGKDSAILLSAN